jgi:hypothetical protein
MGAHSHFPWYVLIAIAIILFGVRWRRQAEPPPQRPFFEGMNLTTGSALAGAMLLALSLLVDVYGADWSLGTTGDDVSLVMAGSGSLLVILSLIFARRPRDDT